ncbi:hypothetical protein CGH87_05325 [Vibrio parahaemolyticus]|uniref:hypothetical protein n=1 Tax=Vibrio parahaemolyticus TaxID=670 RepID=UPI0005429B2D|nr:hypothetical protein [Vibrio parahaemolyticus]EGR3300060.1 hypothetical protein [Vibrio parahaemolyticus]EGR3316999.1 hypothetical protein [Vibrio parahaemolyticus]KHF03831.1 hypothetical protein PO77_21360 [Vibrio parahaemolyticus]TOM01829.1 hypothetical protein CGH87_05325 [Vibrio parahaemolyticus]
MLSILISAIGIIAVILTVTFSVWTFIDTKRKYSIDAFNESKKERLSAALKRHKDKTRLGK